MIVLRVKNLRRSFIADITTNGFSIGSSIEPGTEILVIIISGLHVVAEIVAAAVSEIVDIAANHGGCGEGTTFNIVAGVIFHAIAFSVIHIAAEPGNVAGASTDVIAGCDISLDVTASDAVPATTVSGGGGTANITSGILVQDMV